MQWQRRLRTRGMPRVQIPPAAWCVDLRKKMRDCLEGHPKFCFAILWDLFLFTAKKKFAECFLTHVVIDRQKIVGKVHFSGTSLPCAFCRVLLGPKSGSVGQCKKWIWSYFSATTRRNAHTCLKYGNVMPLQSNSNVLAIIQTKLSSLEGL